MKFTVIASGSRGNAAVLEIDEAKILFDCGVSYSCLKASLQAINLSPADLTTVFITHEHSDHTNGLKTLLGKHRLPLCTRPRTLDALKKTGGRCTIGDDVDFQPIFDRLPLGGIVVEAIPLSHDAADPVGYSVISHNSGEKFALATDLGLITSAVMSRIADADVILLEANHDREMLRRGSYPWPLKQRILSPIGHLDNAAAGEALAHLAKRPQSVIIGHMSEENNRPSVARKTIEEILTQAGISAANFPLTVLGQGEGTHVKTA